MKPRSLRFPSLYQPRQQELHARLVPLTDRRRRSHAQYQGTPDQRRACTPDVYRLCAGEIPNVRAITACLRRNKPSLSDACRAAFEQASQ